jgi:SNF2 family DNA or RNA helicase
MKLREKYAILDAFTDTLDHKGKRKSKDDIQILIGTTRFLGVGLQLTRACNLVLMEPDNEFWRERQGYARIHRIGQRNPLSRSYRLIAQNSEIEQRILKRQQDRKELPGRPIDEEEAALLETGRELKKREHVVVPGPEDSDG